MQKSHTFSARLNAFYVRLNCVKVTKYRDPAASIFFLFCHDVVVCTLFIYALRKKCNEGKEMFKYFFSIEMAKFKK